MPLYLIEVLSARRLPFPRLGAAPFEAEGHIADHAIKKGAEPARASTLNAIEDATLLETLHKNFLNGIVQFLQTRRRLPAGSQSGTHHRTITARKVLPAIGSARCRRPNHRPAR